MKRYEVTNLNAVKREAKIEIAKKMKTKGMDVDTIIEITGLSKEEIEKI